MEVRQRRAPLQGRPSDGSNRLANVQKSQTGSSTSSFGIGSSPIVYQQAGYSSGGMSSEIQPFISPSLPKYDSSRFAGEPVSSAVKSGRGPPKVSVLDDHPSPLREIGNRQKSSAIGTSNPQLNSQFTDHIDKFSHSVIYSQRAQDNISSFEKLSGQQAKQQSSSQPLSFKSTSINEPNSQKIQEMVRSEHIYHSDPYAIQTMLFTWVVVSGFQNNLNAINELIHRFQRHGEILDYEVGKGNWMFIRFATAMQADQAIVHENNQIINQSTLLSVMQLTDELATRLKFQKKLNSMDRIESSKSSIGEINVTHSEYLSSSTPGRGFEQYLQPQKKTQSICQRLVGFFYSY